MPGTLFVVSTPIGNLEDITIRALAVLKRVSVIAAEDTRRTARLLARHAIATSLTSLHEHSEHRKSPALVARLQRGDDIALVSDAGTPVVSDPGARLIRAAIDAGIRVEPIPGPSAALAALVASGFSGDSFLFMGFPPTKGRDRRVWFDAVSNAGRTVVFFEAPHRVLRTLNELREIAGDLPVVVARELTKAHEELVRGPISAVVGSLGKPLGEFTVVAFIGHSPHQYASTPLSPGDVANEFGLLTHNGGLSRREAVAALANKYQRPRNEVYAAIEGAKKLGQ
jgi:16S rRNA (cytidine1402-2'-O)-methyltransferase